MDSAESSEQTTLTELDTEDDVKDEIRFFKKVKLGLWFLFNKDKYLEYNDSLNRKLIIYNKWYFDEESKIWYLSIITSNGEMLQHSCIKEGKLDDAKQSFGQDVKVMYNGAFECDFEIVNLDSTDGTKDPQGYVDAYNLYIKNGSPKMFIFDMLIALDEMEEEGIDTASSTIEEVFDFSHIEKGQP